MRDNPWTTHIHHRVGGVATLSIFGWMAFGAQFAMGVHKTDVAANADDTETTTLVSNQTQNRNGGVELRATRPVIGQIVRTGGSRGTYEFTEITSMFDNTGRAHKFDLKVALHPTTSDNRSGDKVVDLTGNLRERKTNFWCPASPTVLEPNTRYMIVWCCNAGSNNDQNCNGSGEEIEIKLTDSDNKDRGKAAGWSIANNLYWEDDDGNATTHWRSSGIEVKGKPANVPYIVANGVQMYEVNHHEAGKWDIRAVGDDPCGNGEFIAVSVEFSTAVSADADITFRLQIGSVNRGLVPGSIRGNTVIFAAFICPHARDSNGVWIGDTTATLDHNDPDSMQSVADSADEAVRIADFTHTRLGTQSAHKVDGSRTKPRLQSIRVTSKPQHADAYLRGGAVAVEAQFDRPVTAPGRVELKLDIEAFQTTASRFAGNTDGSCMSTLVIEHAVTLFENDSNGIVIPQNTLAQGGDLAAGFSGGGTFVGTQRGLIADLASRKRGPLRTHEMDARFAAVPEIMVGAMWNWKEQTPSSASVEMDFTIIEDPGHFTETNILVLALGWGNLVGVRYAIGLRTEVNKPGTGGSQGKGLIFNRWGTTDPSIYARVPTDGWTEVGNLGGTFISIRRTYEWTAGDYSVRIAQDGDHDAHGRWFGFWITDESSSVETEVGSLKFPSPDEGEPELQARLGFGSLIVVLGDGAVKSHDLAVFEASLGRPDASGRDLPNSVNVTYVQINGIMTNSNVTCDADGDEVVIRVGGATLRTTDNGSGISWDE